MGRGLKHSLGKHWLNDLKGAAKSYVNAASDSISLIEKIDYFARGAQLYDMYFAQSPSDIDLDDINSAVLAHKILVCLSDSPAQKLASLKRSVELFDLSLSIKPSIKAIKGALHVNYQLGLSLSEENEKIFYFERCINLYNQLIKLVDQENISIEKIEILKTCIGHLSNFKMDPFEKMLSLKSILQLKEHMLDIAQDDKQRELESAFFDKLQFESHLLMGELCKNINLYIEKASTLDQMLDMDVVRSPSFLRNAALVYEIIDDHARSKQLNQKANKLESKKNEPAPVSDTPSEFFWKLVEAFVRYS